MDANPVDENLWPLPEFSIADDIMLGHDPNGHLSADAALLPQQPNGPTFHDKRLFLAWTYADASQNLPYSSPVSFPDRGADACTDGLETGLREDDLSEHFSQGSGHIEWTETSYAVAQVPPLLHNSVEQHPNTPRAKHFSSAMMPLFECPLESGHIGWQDELSAELRTIDAQLGMSDPSSLNYGHQTLRPHVAASQIGISHAFSGDSSLPERPCRAGASDSGSTFNTVLPNWCDFSTDSRAYGIELSVLEPTFNLPTGTAGDDLNPTLSTSSSPSSKHTHERARNRVNAQSRRRPLAQRSGIKNKTLSQTSSNFAILAFQIDGYQKAVHHIAPKSVRQPKQPNGSSCYRCRLSRKRVGHRPSLLNFHVQNISSVRWLANMSLVCSARGQCFACVSVDFGLSHESSRSRRYDQ